MEVRNKKTGKSQIITQDDWAVLQAGNLSKHFDVLQENDFVPEELALPTKPNKEKAKETE